MTRTNFYRLLATVALVGAISCGGRDGADDASAAAPEPATSGSATAPGDAAEMTPEARANLKRFVEHRRAERPKATRIELEEGADAIELPDDFPVDVPLHPGANATRYVTSPGGGNMTTLVVDETPDSTLRFYRGALENEGWELEIDGAAPELAMLSATKDGRSLAVAIADDNGATTITLIEGNE